jgi:Metallo-peptidase family M12B Reprolysin-like/Dockerin type I domain
MLNARQMRRRRLSSERLESRFVFAAELLGSTLAVEATASGSTSMADEVAVGDPTSSVESYESSIDGLWELRPRLPATQGLVSYIQPVSFSAVVLDATELNSKLALAPMEFSAEALSSSVQITLPTPEYGFARFAVVKSPIMEPALAAQFPDIMTYSGQGIDDPAATLRFDVTPAGFHAQVLSPNGAYYIDPFWHLDQSVYVSYFKHDLAPRADMEFSEEMFDEHNAFVKKVVKDQTVPDLPFASKGDSAGSQGSVATGAKGGNSGTLARSGTQLRTYRLANAATGEYTAFHGGTVALGQAAIVTAINRVTGIYENELSVRLVLVANNSSLVYTNATTDPYTNGNASSLLTQNQSNIDAVIGNANYDIGHVFSTGGGGLAGLGVVGLAGQKAQGETGLGSPVGDAFYVDYVAHEMGHQFGGNHTFNGVTTNCSGGNRNGGTAYEPGSGSTIQAYAGICGVDDLQAHSDPYFHSVSFDEITRYTTTGVGDAAASISLTGNNVPRVNAGPDFTIPANTPFALNAAGADADSGDVLTYNWEERDLGVAQVVTAADNGTSPIIRSFNPTFSPERVVPRLTNLLINTTAVGEKLPATTRTLSFRATVRDNRSGGGGVNTDDALISVVNTGAGFSVTTPNTAVSWAGNSTQTVTWNVAGTTASPISTANVNVWLSTDGGQTFKILLAANTPNDGSENITVPNITTSTARIKVEAAGNIYFDVSNVNFTINGGANTPPTVSDILNQLVNSSTSTGTIPFTIGDAQTAAAALTVSATSSNTTLLPNTGITLGGSGASRTINLTPALGQFGITTVSVSVTDGSGLEVRETFQLFVEGVTVCNSFQDFDSVTVPALPSGWATSATGATPANWVTSAASSASAPNNIFAPNQGNTSDSQLTTPVIAVTQANNQFKFRNNYNVEDSFDGGVIEISIDGGAFSDLLAAGGSFQAGGYNGTIDSTAVSAIVGRAAWTGNSGGYIDTIAEFPSSAIGHNVQLRLRMVSDDSFSVSGWRIDSTQLCGVPAPAPASTIATRGVLYVGATGTSAATSLATDKSALLPGQSSTYANYTNYSRGLNGVVVDVNGLPATTTNSQLLASLQFAQWDGIGAAGFVALPATAVPIASILAGGGVGGSARVTITFPDNTLQNTWLQITVLANATTGLSTNDVFYFGNVIGELDTGNTSTRYRVNALDTSAVRNNQSTGANSVGVTSIYDVNRDGRVNALDTSIVRNNQQTSGIVAPITAPSARAASSARGIGSAFQAVMIDGAPTKEKEKDDPTLEGLDDYFASL